VKQTKSATPGIKAALSRAGTICQQWISEVALPILSCGNDINVSLGKSGKYEL
jgi:hypothetical protein